ncbi:MAG: hypothetical protein KDE68_09780 [Rhodocyclaceae bacterium]|nr:hypothetical protein [Rhodocyclaceae bacterium]
MILAGIDAILSAFVSVTPELFSTAARWRAHQPQIQAEWENAIKNKGQYATDHGGVRDGSEQGYVQPGDGNDIHAWTVGVSVSVAGWLSDGIKEKE